MNQRARQLYDQLQQDIALCKQKGLDCQTKCECCFSMAEKYWKLLKDELLAYEFETIEDEIEFFKHIKPLFIGQIEYYRLLLSSVHFRPDENETEEVRTYWAKQTNRLGKFISENFEICTYIKEGRTDKDMEWFVRGNNTGGNLLHIAVYEVHPGLTTSHDILVGQFIAVEKYSEYAAEKFKEVVRKSPGL